MKKKKKKRRKKQARRIKNIGHICIVAEVPRLASCEGRPGQSAPRTEVSRHAPRTGVPPPVKEVGHWPPGCRVHVVMF